MIERWRLIEGFKNKYLVSELGRVKSLFFNKVRILKAAPNNQGYPLVSLWINGISYGYNVHVLVLSAFVGLRPFGMVCDHLDGDKSNNCLSNLHWCTLSENVLRGPSPKSNKKRCGILSSSSKLNETEVLEIRRRYAQGKITQRELGKQFNVVQATIYYIVNRKSWVSLRDL